MTFGKLVEHMQEAFQINVGIILSHAQLDVVGDLITKGEEKDYSKYKERQKIIEKSGLDLNTMEGFKKFIFSLKPGFPVEQFQKLSRQYRYCLDAERHLTELVYALMIHLSGEDEEFYGDETSRLNDVLEKKGLKGIVKEYSNERYNLDTMEAALKLHIDEEDS